MAEFQYFPDHGYFTGGGWKEITYRKRMPLQHKFPDEWNDEKPEHEPIANLIDKCFVVKHEPLYMSTLFQVSLIYKFSDN